MAQATENSVSVQAVEIVEHDIYRPTRQGRTEVARKQLGEILQEESAPVLELLAKQLEADQADRAQGTIEAILAGTYYQPDEWDSL